MSKNADHEGLIDRYLLGELSEAESAAFEKRLETEEKLREEYDTVRAAHFLIAFDREQEIRNVIAEIAQPSRKRFLKPAIWIPVAASIAILAVFAWFLNSKTLFEQFYEPYPNNISMLGTALELERAMEFYDEGNYEEALPLLQDYEDTDYLEVSRLHLAICALETGDLPLARTTLITLSESSQTEVADPAKWYLALAYLKEDQSDAARPYLEDLKNRQVRKYGPLAKKVLDRL